MRKTPIQLLASLSVLAGLATVTTDRLESAELKLFGTNLPAIDFHGFASQGFIYNTGDNDYLGGDSSEGSFDFREYGANATMSKGKWRIGAQFFGQKLGPYGEDKIRLDWGSVDYQAAQWFGMRAGRVKTPRGLYNEALDLDSTRPFVLLPQSVYDARLRDFNASFDGGLLYGNISMKKAGSLDYRAFYGAVPMSTKSGASDYFNVDAPFPNLEIGMDAAFGGTLFWNTPVQGLRVGYSFMRFENFETRRYVPFRFTDTLKTAPTYDRHLASIEYTLGNWTFAAEGGVDDTEYNVAFPGGAQYATLFPEEYYLYVSAAWRVKPWLELGTYYSYSHFEQSGVGTPVVFPDLNQGDFALSARFDLNDHILFKVEGHYLDGSGKVFDLPSKPQPSAQRDDSWFLFATKLTFTF